MSRLGLSNACSRYGASMGRDSTRDRDLAEIIAEYHSDTVKVSLRRVPLDAGGYDEGGAYWGTGEPLWRATDDLSNMTLDTFVLYFRAPSRGAAKAHVTSKVPNARFYR